MKEKSKNPVGKPPKFKTGIKTKKLIRFIPEKRENEILEAIDKITKPDQNER